MKAEVAIYLYKKVDESKPAAWENSGTQKLQGTKTGTDWFTSIPGTLPAAVCGTGWAYQQDKVKDWSYAGAFNWPTTINYPTDNIGAGLYDSQHGELSSLITVPACAPVTPPVTKAEVGIYIYQKLDSTKPAAWENSGTQTFCESKTGTDWFTSITCTLPTQVCGTDWAYQQDKVKDWSYVGAFKWPTNITYPVDNIGHPPIYDSKHGDLSELTTVPACVPPQPQPLSGHATSYSVDCALVLTTTVTPWTQQYTLTNNVWVLDPKVFGTPVTSTRTTTLAELATLNVTAPTNCAVTPPPVTPPTVTPPTVTPPTVVPPVVTPPQIEAPPVVPPKTITTVKIDAPQAVPPTTERLASTGFDADQTTAVALTAFGFMLGGILLAVGGVIVRRRRHS